MVALWNQHKISQEPLLTTNGEVVAEPVFWFKNDNKAYACFGKNEPRQRVIQRLEDFGIELLRMGDLVREDDSK